MKQNIGRADRLTRLVAAFVIGFVLDRGYITGTWAMILGVVGIIFLVTSAAGVCLLYAPFRFSTTKKPSSHA